MKANSYWNALERVGTQFPPSGWQLAECAFHWGFLFSLLAGNKPASSSVWTPDRSRRNGSGQRSKSSPGIEASPRLVRSASGRGAAGEASHTPHRQPSPKRGSSRAASPSGPAGLFSKKPNAVLFRTQGEAK